MTTTDEKIQALQEKVNELEKKLTVRPWPCTGQQLFDFWDTSGLSIEIWSTTDDNVWQFRKIDEIARNPLGQGWLVRFVDGKDSELVFPHDNVMVRVTTSNQI